MGEVEGRYSGQWYSLSLLNGEMKVAEAETTLQQLPKVSASCFSHPLTKKILLC